MVRLRFAPSPTGYMHVGNARIALANHLFARRHGGSLLLRLDDTDLERSRPEYEAAIPQDLAWLGIAWSETFRQRDRLLRYEAAAARLREAGRLYPCFETEEELKYKREQARRRGAPPVYDRAMLRLTDAQREAALASGKKPYWRFKLSDREIRWTDLVLGPRAVKLTAVSDPVLIRADGTPLYTFTSVVDDIETSITHIVRGEDHVTNTGVQLDLLQALGGDPSAIALAHLPLLTDTEGGKLSKRLDSLALRSLRHDGIEPAALAAYLARLGTSLSPALVASEELARTFDFTTFSRASPRFDMAQLLALNRAALHAAPFDAVRDRLPQGATERFWLAIRSNLDLLSEARLWWQVTQGDIVPPSLAGEADFLRDAEAHLPAEPWDETSFAGWTAVLKAQTGRSGRQLFKPLRLALTGEPQGPEMAALMPLMGGAKVRERLRLAALGQPAPAAVSFPET